MKRFVFAVGLILLVGWFGHPYLVRAADKNNQVLVGDASTRPIDDWQAGSQGNSWINLASSSSIFDQLSSRNAVLSSFSSFPATRPEIVNSQPSELKQVRGHAGFWRLAQNSDGVWWFMSPVGKLEFLNTVTTVQPFQGARDKFSPHFVSRDWDGGDKITGGDLQQWAQATLQRVKEAGFKGLGAWCNPAFHQLDVPMTQDLNLWMWAQQITKHLYSPEWKLAVEQACQRNVEPLKDNKNLVGYFTDNELDWGDAFSGPGMYFDYLAIDDVNRQQVVEVIHQVWPTLEEFNAAWKTQLADWSQLDAWTVLPRVDMTAYLQLSHAWRFHLATDYFRMTTEMVRRYDPNHLILGVRFRGSAPVEVARASKPYTDAQSLNYYVADARFDSDMFHMINRESEQPLIISEYAFHSLDGRSGNRDTAGFSAQVPDQQARADGYRLMTSRLSRVPFVVGADWFQWFDESPAGRQGDGEDVNFGVVDIDDRPYQPLVDAIRQTAPTLNPTHARSAAASEADVWRECYATKPMMHVPFLAKPPVLNGNLDHWPSEAKLPSVRSEQTVGIERSVVPTPEFYLGWTKGGIYLGMQVFDNHIVAAPASGYWWTRDHVEFWISTRPVPSDLNTYDANCHQFFFVPNDYVNRDGVAGVVGQWHRQGDGLQDNLIPHPGIDPSVRILPDRYVVEMFIPATALHGYDPEHEPSMAFNVNVREFESAAEFFWSAPQSSQTQLQPNTWGTLYLDAPTNAPSVAVGPQARAE